MANIAEVWIIEEPVGYGLYRPVDKRFYESFADAYNEIELGVFRNMDGYRATRYVQTEVADA